MQSMQNDFDEIIPRVLHCKPITLRCQKQDGGICSDMENSENLTPSSCKEGVAWIGKLKTGRLD